MCVVVVFIDSQKQFYIIIQQRLEDFVLSLTTSLVFPVNLGTLFMDDAIGGC